MKIIKFDNEIRQEQYKTIQKIIDLINNKQLNNDVISTQQNIINNDKCKQIQKDLSMNLEDILDEIYVNEFAKNIYATTIANLSTITYEQKYIEKQSFICIDLLHTFGINTTKTDDIFANHYNNNLSSSNFMIKFESNEQTSLVTDIKPTHNEQADTDRKIGFQAENIADIKPTHNDQADTEIGLQAENITDKKLYLQNASNKSFNGFMIFRVIFNDKSYNIMTELSRYCEWASTNLHPNTYYFCIIIDTDQIENLRKLQQKWKYKPHILIKNHIEFQQWLITKYEK